MQLLLNEFFQLLLCNLQERCPNSTDLQRLTEIVFVVELKTSLNFLQGTNCFRKFGYQMNECHID